MIAALDILVRVHETPHGWEIGLTGWGLVLFVILAAAVTR